LVNPQMKVRPASGSHAACAATGADIAMAAASRADALLRPMNNPLIVLAVKPAAAD